MNKSVLTIVRLVFFSLMLVVLVVLMILNITERGIGTGMDKILLAPLCPAYTLGRCQDMDSD